MIFTILEASKAQVKTLQNHDVIRLRRIVLKRVKLIPSIHVSSFLSKTPVETLSEADASSAYPKVFNADLYDSASFEAKKMIVSQLIRRVDVYRGYQIHVDFNFDLAQYLENSDELAC